MTTVVSNASLRSFVSISTGINEGDEIHRLPPAPWVSTGSYTIRPDFQARTVTSTLDLHRNSTWAAAPSSANPVPLVAISWDSGGTAGPLADSTWVATPWIMYAPNYTRTTEVGVDGALGLECCNGSVVAYVSDTTGMSWHLRSIIASKETLTKLRIPSEEGPNENTVVILRDGKTLLCVIRVDGGDGAPHSYHRPYLFAQSQDNAFTWSLKRAPPQLLSARPRALVLGNGALLLSGGRPGLGLWVSTDGFGKQWKSFDIPTEHNRLVADPAQKYCSEFLAANATLGEYSARSIQFLHDYAPHCVVRALS
jgi:hypothetical protein